MSESNPQSGQTPAPPQGQSYYPPMYYQAPEDEIDLRELFAVLWQGKWWIIGITALFAIASVFYALSLPNEYKATAIVAPASSGADSNLSRAAGQLGGLASLAGINLGGGESNDAMIAMEIMKTWGFQESFIRKHNLEVPVFAAVGWNAATNDLILDTEIYSETSKKWVREAPRGKASQPSGWELYKKFKVNLSVSQNKDSGLITIGYTHYSPQLAQKITSWLIDEINDLMKERALTSAERNIDYLESQIKQTSLSDMQAVFYTLIEEETKTKMLANVSDEYVFKYLSNAKVPEEKSKPSRALVCILGVFFGGFLSIIFVFIRHYYTKD